MNNFNKYQFITDLEDYINGEIVNNHIEDSCDLEHYIDEAVQGQTIYYSDCFDIIRELGFTDWSRCDYEIKNISMLAYVALTEYVQENLDLKHFYRLIATISHK